MTDNCWELRQALRFKWPSSVLLLCVFHLLQQVWRWLFAKEHGIAEADRQNIMSIIKGVLYSESEIALSTSIDEIDSNDTIQVWLVIGLISLFF